jgi:hypothetical protein
VISPRLSTLILALALPVAALANVDQDRMTMNRARAEYAKGNYASAEKLYSSIGQTSDYFPLAIEERAHTYGKSGEYNKSLADTTTLFSPVFVNAISSEPYFTAALTHFRLCQYKQVYDILGDFKKNMRPRIEALNELAERKATPALAEAVHNLRAAKEMSSLAYAKNANVLPQLFHLDYTVKAAIQNGNNVALTNRIAQLASDDLKDIASTLKKLNLVEAEIMQRLNYAEAHKDSDRKRMGKFKRDKDQLVFPYNGEVWVDELDSYQVQSENCPKG